MRVGAQPRKLTREGANRPEYLGQNWDITGSCPRALHFPLNNKPEYNLKNDDIERSKPQCQRFITTRIPSNPLNPQYKLSEVEYRPPTPPKFIRDQITNADIDGAKAKVKVHYETRDILRVEDIEGAKYKGAYLRKTKFDTFNYDDVTKCMFKTTRQTNPLQPTYKTRDDQGNVIEIGEISGSSPKKLPFRKTPHDGIYQTRDIVGAAPGSKGLGAFHSLTRKDFIDPNDIKDIEGARPNTVQRGVRTVRVTDPLNPSYKLPGATEIPNSDNNPYSGSSMDPRFIAAKKASEAREKLLKQPPRPQTTTDNRRQ